MQCFAKVFRSYKLICAVFLMLNQFLLSQCVVWLNQWYEFGAGLLIWTTREGGRTKQTFEKPIWKQPLLHQQWCGNFPLQLQQCYFHLSGFCSKNKFIIMLVIVIVNNEIQNLLHWKAESFLDVLNFRDCSDSLWL